MTGFEPFGGETVNASWEAARRLDGWRCGDCVAEFVAAFERIRPAAVLMTGQAAGRGVICVERFARSVDGVTAPDNRGVIGGGEAAAAAPERLEATASVRAIARAIRAAGLDARVSINAGGFVCNHLYLGALKVLRAETPPTRAVFVHLPATPRQRTPRASQRRLATADAARALAAAAAALLGE